MKNIIESIETSHFYTKQCFSQRKLFQWENNLTFNFLNVYCFPKIEEPSRSRIILNNGNKQFQDGVCLWTKNDNLSSICQTGQKGIKDELLPYSLGINGISQIKLFLWIPWKNLDTNSPCRISINAFLVRLNSRAKVGGDMWEVTAHCKVGWKQNPVQASYCFEAVSGWYHPLSTPGDRHLTLVQYNVLDHMQFSFESS